MADITVRAEQTTTEFDEGAVFTLEHTDRVDKLIADGRLTRYEKDDVTPPEEYQGGQYLGTDDAKDKALAEAAAQLDQADTLISAQQSVAKAKQWVTDATNAADRKAATLDLKIAEQELAQLQDTAPDSES